MVFLSPMLAGANPGRGHGFGNFSVHNMNGRYIEGGTAWDASSTPPTPAVPFVAAGYLQLDGKGNVSAGEETLNYDTPGSGDSFTCELAGTYVIDSSTGRVILTLNSTPGPAVTPGESVATNNAQCAGTDTVVGYLDGPDGKRLATVEQTVVTGTPPAGVAADTPILSAHVWTKSNA
jgi:hypothetical protein